MTASRADGPARQAAERASHIELLFDVAFVFALAQTSATIFADLSPAVLLRNLLVIAAFWLVWAYTTWTTNLLGADRLGTHAVLIAIMLGIGLMGAAVPEAFGEDGLIFAVLYVMTHIGRTAYLAIAIRGRPGTPKGLPMLIWSCITGAVWIAGGLSENPLRAPLWGLGIALTLASSRSDFWLPFAGRSGYWEGNIAASHIADRYQQIIILALGEQFLAAGVVLADQKLDPHRIVAFVVAFSTTILFWWIYFNRAGSLISQTITSTTRRGRHALSISYAHLVMFAGIMVTSVGEKIVITHAMASAGALWVAVIIGGPAMFLIGREWLNYLTAGTIARFRVIGLAVLAVMSLAMISHAPELVLFAVNVVLLATAIGNIASRKRPLDPTPPALR